MKNHLCQLNEMAGDVPADMLAEMTDLETVLADANCTFRCRNQEQVSPVSRGNMAPQPRPQPSPILFLS